jgi:uncharacterized phage protein (TIGR02220 family)
MEIISFINALRKKGGQYYNIWLPIFLQFNKEEPVIITLNVPLNVPKTTYYRIIKYGLAIFPNCVKQYELVKNHSTLILTKKKYYNEEVFSEKHQINNSSNKSLNKNEIVLEATVLDNKNSETNIKEKVVTEPINDKPKVSRKKSDVSFYPNEVYEEIIDFLNQSSGKNYKHNSAINRKFITSRLNDGFTIDDFKKVIAVKSTNWLGSKMEQFLRPETLFSNKFESYLNENIVYNAPNSNLKNTYDQVNLATEYFNSQG